MDFQIQKEQAERLKQILLPKKTKASRVSSSKTFFQSSKQNKPYNRVEREDLKTTLKRLKADIDRMLQKQSQIYSITITPRQCLQKIKAISQSMEVYPQAIQQACSTLLDSVPQPHNMLVPTRHYYLLMSTGHCLNSIFKKISNRIALQCFEEIKKRSTEVKETTKIQKGKKKQIQLKFQLTKNMQKSFAFNKWRLSIVKENKEQKMREIESKGGLRTQNRMLNLLCHQAKAVMYLQTMVGSQADATEILIFNPKNGTLRAYVQVQEQLTSVFETVSNQSQPDEQNYEVAKKLKRIQFNLQSSLTKICLSKKQILKIDELRNDVDYNKIDNIILAQEISGREMIGGAIFTPLLNQAGHSIGLLRQYYFDRVGKCLGVQRQQQISRLFEYCLDTSSIFDNLKQKIEYIKNDYYLKSMRIMNRLQKIENGQQLNNTIQEELIRQFGIQWVQQYGYEVNYQISYANFTINSHPQRKKNINEAITILQKMNNIQTYYIYNNSVLYIKTNQHLYAMGIQHNHNGLQHVPVKLIHRLLEQRQAVREKIEREELANRQKQQYENELLMMEKERKVKQEIGQYCINMHKLQNSREQVMSMCRDYSSKFMDNACILYDPSFSQQDRPSGQYLHNRIWITYPHNHNHQEHAIQIQALRDLLAITLKESTPHQSKVTKIKQTIYSKYNVMDNPTNNIMQVLKQVYGVQKVQCRILPHNPYQNQYYSMSMQYRQWMQVREWEQSKLLKHIRSYNSKQGKDSGCIVCISNNILLYVNKHIHIDDSMLQELNTMYKAMQTNKEAIESENIKYKQRMKYSKGMHKIGDMVHNRKQDAFANIKQHKCNMNTILRLPITSQFIHNHHYKLTNYAYSVIKCHNTHHHEPCPTYNVTKFVKVLHKYAINKCNTHLMFRIYQKGKQRERAIRSIQQYVSNKRHMAMMSAYDNIYYQSIKPKHNMFSPLQTIVNSQCRKGFDLIRECSDRMLREYESHCSKIIKLNRISSIFKWVSIRYPHYELYLQLKGNTYMNGDGVCEIEGVGKRKYEFMTNTNTNTNLMRIVWLVPDVLELQLSQKHHLQFISKAIEQVYKKIRSNYFASFEFVKQVDSRLKLNMLQYGIKQWRGYSGCCVKNEQFDYRNEYYDICLQVNNLKDMEKQFGKDEENRKTQKLKQEEMIKKHENKIASKRQNVVRLDISSRKYEESQSAVLKEKRDNEVKRMFNVWRKEANKIGFIKRKGFQRNNNSQKLRNMKVNRVLKRVYESRVWSGLNMIKGESYRAKVQLQKLQKNALKGKDMNRLMTFQDDLSQSVDQIDKSQIRFKQFDLKEQEKVLLTEEQAKKMNKGSYKLNPKTLKFLKRMGKLQQ